jgi:hypothetical protein
MKTSPNGVNFIETNEGFYPLPALDNGHQVWGHGHDRRAGEPVPASISPAAAEALLVSDLSPILRAPRQRAGAVGQSE